MSVYANLEKLAGAMGHDNMGLDFLMAVKAQGAGALPRLAVQHGLDATVGIAAKIEFNRLMEDGRRLFAPKRG